MSKRMGALLLAVSMLIGLAFPLAAIAQPAADAPVYSGGTLITLGDSLTAIGEWPQRVATALNMKLVNSGIGGDTTEDVNNRFERDVVEKVPAEGETFLTIGLGTNDFALTNGEKKVSVERYGELLRQFVDKGQALGVHVILLTPPIICENVYNDVASYPEGSYKAALAVYADEMRAVAAEKQAGLIDMNTLTNEGFTTEVGEFLGSDGVHFAEPGKQFYTDTIVQYFKDTFKEDPSVPTVPQPKPPVLQEGYWTQNFVSFEPEDWFVIRQGTMTVEKEADGSLSFANTNGLWPEIHYSPISDDTVVVPYENSFITMKITAEAQTSLMIYYNGANPTVGYDHNFVSLNAHVKKADPSIQLESGSGDILGGQEIDVAIKISDFIPSSDADADGNIILSGMKVFAVGAAGKKVTLHEMSVTHPDPAELPPEAPKPTYEDAVSLLDVTEDRIEKDQGDADWTINEDGSLTIARAQEDTLSWPSIKITLGTEVDLNKTPAVHLALSTAGGGSANGYIHLTDAAGKTYEQQLSAAVKGDPNDFTEDLDVYFNLAKITGASGTVTIDDIVLSVYGLTGNSILWKTFSTAKEITTFTASGGGTVEADEMLPEGSVQVAIEEKEPDAQLSEQLPGVLAVYDISVLDGEGNTVPVEGNQLTVRLPLTEALKGFEYYQVVSLGQTREILPAEVDGEFLVFKTTHLSEYAVQGSNEPFAEEPSEDILDASKLYQYVSGAETLTEEELARADINSDKAINMLDAYILYLMASGQNR